MFYVSGVRCKMACVNYHVGHVASHMSLTPTATATTATDPPLANSYDQEINFFPQAIFLILSPMSFNHFPLRNLFVIVFFLS